MLAGMEGRTRKDAEDAHEEARRRSGRNGAAGVMLREGQRGEGDTPLPALAPLVQSREGARGARARMEPEPGRRDGTINKGRPGKIGSGRVRWNGAPAAHWEAYRAAVARYERGEIERDPPPRRLGELLRWWGLVR